MADPVGQLLRLDGWFNCGELLRQPPGLSRQAPVEDRVGGEYPTHIAPGLVKGDILDPDSRIELIPARKPLFYTRGPGIVGSRRQHRVVTESLQHLAQVESSKPYIAVGIGEGVETLVRQLDFRSGASSCRRHELHHTDGSCNGSDIGHKKTFAARHAISPAVRDSRGSGMSLELLAVGQRIAQLEVVIKAHR